MLNMKNINETRSISRSSYNSWCSVEGLICNGRGEYRGTEWKWTWKWTWKWIPMDPRRCTTAPR